MTSSANPDEPTIGASSLSDEPTVVAASDDSSSSTVDVPEAQQSQQSSANPDDVTASVLSDDANSKSDDALPALPLSDLPSTLTQVSVSQPAKSRRGFWITLALVVIVIIVGSVFGVIYNNRSTPTKTLKAFCSAFSKSDAQGVYNQLSSHGQATTSVSKLKDFFGFIQVADGIRGCTISNVQDNGSMATGNVILTLDDGHISSPTLYHLVNESGTWKIDQGPTH